MDDERAVGKYGELDPGVHGLSNPGLAGDLGANPGGFHQSGPNMMPSTPQTAPLNETGPWMLECPPYPKPGAIERIPQLPYANPGKGS